MFWVSAKVEASLNAQGLMLGWWMAAGAWCLLGGGKGYVRRRWVGPVHTIDGICRTAAKHLPLNDDNTRDY